MLLSDPLRRTFLSQRVFSGRLAFTLACLSRTVVDICNGATQTKTTSMGTCISGAAARCKGPTFTSVFHAGPYHCTTPIRKFSSPSDTPQLPTETVSAEASTDVHFEKLISLIETGNIQLFDVREPDELRDTGRMPGAVNIPLGEVGKAFDLTPEAFQGKYGARKPEKTDADVVFTCLGGFRSKCALDAVVEKGYNRVRHYPGGWEEWSVRKGLAPAPAS